MLSAEGATFLGVNRGTPSWPRAWMTSPSCVSHPFGDHLHLSLHARATGNLVLTRVLGVGGQWQGQLIQGQPWTSVLVSSVFTGTQRPGPLLSLPVSIYGTFPQSQGPGLLLIEPAANSWKLLWPQVPGFFLRVASLGNQFQNASEDKEHATVALRAAL